MTTLETNAAVRAIKPTEVGGAAKRQYHDKTAVNKGRFEINGYPHCGEGCGDTRFSPHLRHCHC